MKQMVNTAAPTIATLPAAEVELGFTRDHEGRIFLISSNEQETKRNVVLEDGSIIIHQHESLSPDQSVNIVHARDLGVPEFKYASEDSEVTS